MDINTAKKCMENETHVNAYESNRTKKKFVCRGLITSIQESKGLCCVRYKLSESAPVKTPSGKTSAWFHVSDLDIG